MPQIYIQARNPANLNLKMVKDEYPDKPLELVGALGKKHHYQQFQPVVTLAKGYTVHWDAAAPAEVTVWIINFNKSVIANLTKKHDYKLHNKLVSIYIVRSTHMEAALVHEVLINKYLILLPLLYINLN